MPFELSRAWNIMMGLFNPLHKSWTKRDQRATYMTKPYLMLGWIYPSVITVIRSII
jgi:hypothetical protein